MRARTCARPEPSAPRLSPDASGVFLGQSARRQSPVYRTRALANIQTMTTRPKASYPLPTSARRTSAAPPSSTLRPTDPGRYKRRRHDQRPLVRRCAAPDHAHRREGNESRKPSREKARIKGGRTRSRRQPQLREQDRRQAGYRVRDIRAWRPACRSSKLPPPRKSERNDEEGAPISAIANARGSTCTRRRRSLLQDYFADVRPRRRIIVAAITTSEEMTTRKGATRAHRPLLPEY